MQQVATLVLTAAANVSVGPGPVPTDPQVTGKPESQPASQPHVLAHLVHLERFHTMDAFYPRAVVIPTTSSFVHGGKVVVVVT